MSSILYLGPEGTYSHEAVKLLLPKTSEGIPCRTFHDIFERLAQDPTLSAVIPFENSIEGPVAQILDLLSAYPKLEVHKALSMQIRHNLVTHPGTELRQITQVLSHPHALAQCSAFLRKNLPDAEWIETTSTAAAAHQVAGMPQHAAAIASITAAESNGLVVNKRAIQDTNDNITRFFLIGAKTDAPKETTRVLFHVTLPNEPGALLKVLQPFNTVGVNLTSIQSRPQNDQAFQYGFFIEATTTPELAQLLANLLGRFAKIRILGLY